MMNQWMWKSVGVAACLLCSLLTGCFMYEMGKVNYPPTELTWIKKGWNSAQVRVELTACYSQRKSTADSISTEAYDEGDLCMLRKGFAPLPNPDRFRWFDACEDRPQRIKCRVYRGEMVVPPDETALQIKPDPLVKPKPERESIECRKDKPKYEAAYCQCYAETPYANLASCDRLLKYQYKWKEPSPDSQSPSLEPTEVKRSDQLLRENLKELQNAQDKTQVKPYAPPSNVPAAPQVPNPRLDKLRGG